MTIFDRIMGKFHLRFKDRESAGNILGKALTQIIKKEDRKNSLVLGIPRGGVITAYCIARKLNCPSDIIIPRKLRAPHNEEIAIGAVTGDGTTYLNDVLIKELGVTSDYIEDEKLYQLNEIDRRSSLYCPNKKTLTGVNHFELNNKIVILADDGTATGATFIVATRCIRSSGHTGQIYVATPVAPSGTVDLLNKEDIDHVEVITSPPNSTFKSVEQYYQDFHQITDDEVIDILARPNRCQN